MKGLIALWCIAVVAVGVVAVAVHEEGPEHPDAWDPRVADLVTFVEQERGHEFEHPVFVDFLDAAAYSERTRTDESALSEDEQEELAIVESTFRALALIPNDVDLLATFNSLNDTGTLAFYDPDEERVIVRGTELTPGIRGTLVHELTHVMQDQVWGLDDLDDHNSTSGEQLAYRALVEGDAMRIEDAYDELLSDEDRAAADAEDEASSAGFDEAAIPPAVTALFGLPYALGDALIAVLETQESDGLNGVDYAFDQPPTSEEHLLDPIRYLEEDEPVAVPTPSTDGPEVLDDGDFGAATLYIVLAERIPIHDALRAATGWGGDAYVVFERDARTCVRIDVVGDSPTDDEELTSAFAAWVAAAPPNSAGSADLGDAVRLESCDAGEASVPGNGASQAALGLAAVRSYTAAGALDEGLDRDQARCFANAFIEAIEPEEILEGEPTQERIVEVATQAALACR